MLAFLGFALLATLYMIPAIVGIKKKSAVAITVVNVLFGWTILGWIACLIWACEGKD